MGDGFGLGASQYGYKRSNMVKMNYISAVWEIGALAPRLGNHVVVAQKRLKYRWLSCLKTNLIFY